MDDLKLRGATLSEGLCSYTFKDNDRILSVVDNHCNGIIDIKDGDKINVVRFIDANGNGEADLSEKAKEVKLSRLDIFEEYGDAVQWEISRFNGGLPSEIERVRSLLIGEHVNSNTANLVYVYPQCSSCNPPKSINSSAATVMYYDNNLTADTINFITTSGISVFISTQQFDSEKQCIFFSQTRKVVEKYLKPFDLPWYSPFVFLPG